MIACGALLHGILTQPLLDLCLKSIKFVYFFIEIGPNGASLLVGLLSLAAGNLLVVKLQVNFTED